MNLQDFTGPFTVIYTQRVGAKLSLHLQPVETLERARAFVKQLSPPPTHYLIVEGGTFHDAGVLGEASYRRD